MSPSLYIFAKKKMHRGFELFIDKTAFEKSYYDLAIEAGKKRYDNAKVNIRSTLDSFISKNGKLDGSKMQANWIPQVSADIFISHSHQDEDLAILLSEYFHQTFGLTVFIDSCIWGYANDLLKLIDDEYCLNSSGETYNYTKRNYSTSHIHMMLSTALTMMIDKSECVLFLNTPNSITPNEVITKTKSPWIYSEIAMTSLVRQKPLNEYRVKKITESFSEGGEIRKGLDFEYAINTDHLTSISKDILLRWKKEWDYEGKKYTPDYSKHALDILYSITSKNNRYEYFEK